jgi:hypothetical protein
MLLILVVTFPTVSVSLDGRDEELRQLARWLRDEDELRGRVSLVEPPIGPGQMGSVLDTVQVVLTSGTAGTFVTSLFAWLGHRRVVGRVKLKVRNGDRTIELTCGSADDANELIDRVSKILTDGE